MKMPGIASFKFLKISVSKWVTSYCKHLKFVPVLEKAIKMCIVFSTFISAFSIGGVLKV